MGAVDLKSTWTEHVDSERYFLTPSCMDSLVLDSLEDQFKEAAENDDAEGVTGKDLEYDEVAAAG